MTELAEKMIAYRAKHNMTQKELASRCNVSELTIINAERGRSVTNLTRGKIELVGDECSEVKEDD